MAISFGHFIRIDPIITWVSGAYNLPNCKRKARPIDG